MADGPAFVHTDMVMAHALCGSRSRGTALFEEHLRTIRKLADTRAIWMPTYNYAFPTTRVFSIRDDVCEVGVLNEYFRKEVAEWRTHTPIFSVAGLGPQPMRDLEGTFEIDPFGDVSLYARICEADGSYVFYGASIDALTLIHHVESVSGGPPYRYAKTVDGSVIGDKGSQAVRLSWHVRPLGLAMEYDWVRIETDLTREGFLRSSFGGVVAELGVRDARDYLLQRLEADPLYLLTPDSRTGIQESLDRLGRGFRLEDFE